MYQKTKDKVIIEKSQLKNAYLGHCSRRSPALDQEQESLAWLEALSEQHSDQRNELQQTFALGYLGTADDEGLDRSHHCYITKDVRMGALEVQPSIP